MIHYQTYCQIRHLFTEKRLSLREIARELKLDFKTVCKWAKRESFQKAPCPKRDSKLDPFKGQIVRLLERHPYSARQIFQQIKEAGYGGQYTIVKAFVRQVRPKPRPAFLTLHFEPGQCAQVDWGCAGSVAVGSTRRRLSFFLMVLAFSRKMYLEFTLAETMEHFLSCHQRAFEYFNGVVRQVWVDNCKVAVLSRGEDGSVVFNPHYLDFANHHGFQIRACGVGQPQEKGRVENGVAYVKKNFLNGLELSDFKSINPAARHWLDQIANVRIHGQTQKMPQELFAQEKLKSLHPLWVIDVEKCGLTTGREDEFFALTMVCRGIQEINTRPWHGPEPGGMQSLQSMDDPVLGLHSCRALPPEPQGQDKPGGVLGKGAVDWKKGWSSAMCNRCQDELHQLNPKTSDAVRS
jgi:transposase